MAKSKVVICPYCGETQPADERCRSCAGLFEPLSRHVTHNAMGPWYLRDSNRPFQPGCSYETLVKMVEAGRVSKYTIVRGPTTKQFWTVAKHVPGVAHLVGYCHNCDEKVSPDSMGCPGCGTPFGAYLERNYLGLPEVRPLVEAESGAGEDISGERLAAFFQPVLPRGGTISSFATDEELTSHPGSFQQPHPSHYAPGGGGTATAVAMETEADRETVLDGEEPPTLARILDEPAHEYAEAAARRAIERRLAKEQRLVRILFIIVFLSVAASVLSNVGWVRGWFGSTNDREVSGPQQPSGDANVSSDLRELDGDSGNSTGMPGDAGDGAGSDEVALADPPIIDDSAGEAIDTPAIDPGPSVAEYKLATELIAKSEDEKRDLKLRIEDLESALTILRDLQQDVSASELPEDPATLIPRLERELERLKLKVFFD